ncbi:helix-turn-helix domain-containing protein [Gordonia sp. MP11Mi]
MQDEASDDLNQRVGRNVAKWRKDQGMSQAELADQLAQRLGKAKIDPTTITRMESGKRPTTVAEIESMARIFSVEVDAFFVEESPELGRLRAEVKDWGNSFTSILVQKKLMEGRRKRAMSIVSRYPGIEEKLTKAEQGIYRRMVRDDSAP